MHPMSRLCVLLLAFLLTSRAGGFDETAVPEETPAGGVAVMVEPADAAEAIALGKSGAWLVLATVADEDRRRAMREAVLEAGVAGRVSVVDPVTPDRVPTIANFAQLVVADLGAMGDAGPDLPELRRATAPLGVTRVRRGGRWEDLEKPLPAEMDGWFGYDYDAAGNPISRDTALEVANTLRWSGGASAYARGGMMADVGMRLSDGAAVYVERGVEDAGHEGRDARGHWLVCRDAFSGMMRWRRELTEDTGLPSQHAFLAQDGRAWLQVERGEPMLALDLATGREVKRYDAGLSAAAITDDKGKPRRLAAKRSPSGSNLIARLAAGRLVQCDGRALVCLDAETGERLWAQEAEDKNVLWFVIGDGKVFYAEAARGWMELRGASMFDLDAVVACDLTTGRELWRHEGLKGRASTRLVFADGDLFVPHFGPGGKPKELNPFGFSTGYRQDWHVTRLDGDTGEPVWSNTDDRTAAAHYQVAMLHPRWGFLVLGQNGIRYDADTGEARGGLNFSPFDGCGEVRGTPEFLFYTMDFLRLDDAGKVQQADPGMGRSSCDTGVFPGYAAVHTTPSQCGCNEYPPGYNSFTREPLPPAVADAERLVAGPAAGTPATGLDAPWPMAMGNAARGGYTETPGPEQPAPRWQTPPLARYGDGAIGEDWALDDWAEGPITQPTVGPAGVYVADRRGGVVIALDPDTGRERWRFPTGGPVDAPPTVVGELVVAGSGDGWVYALRAADGEVVWRFLAARAASFATEDSSLVSRWPVGGSVLHHQGSLYAIAGRHSSIDDGMWVWRLDPATGKPLAHTRIHTDPAAYAPHNRTNFGGNRRGRDLLLGVGDQIVHRQEAIDAALTPAVWVTDPGVAADLNVAFAKPAVPVLQARQHMLNTRRTPFGRFFTAAWSYPRVDAPDETPPKRESRSITGMTLALTPTSLVAADKGLRVYDLTADGRASHAPRADHRLEEIEGRKGWQFMPDALAVAGDRIYLATADRALRVHALNDLRPLHRVELPGRVHRHALAIGHGRVYATLRDGSVICLGQKAPAHPE